jgi:hypothetical protein
MIISTIFPYTELHKSKRHTCRPKLIRSLLSCFNLQKAGSSSCAPKRSSDFKRHNCQNFLDKYEEYNESNFFFLVLSRLPCSDIILVYISYILSGCDIHGLPIIYIFLSQFTILSFAACYQILSCIVWVSLFYINKG